MESARVAEIKSLAETGKTMREIASAIGLSYSRVVSICKGNGIKAKRPNTKRPLSALSMQIIEYRRNGKSYSEIANITGAEKGHVVYICQQNGLGGKAKGDILDIDTVEENITKSGFEYVGGYTNASEDVKVRCPVCGGTFMRRYHIFRSVANGNWIGSDPGCPICKETEIRAKQEKERIEHDAHMAELKKERERKQAERDSRAVNDELIKRLASHVCLTCGQTYCIAVTGYNSTKYCSSNCQVNRYRKDHDKRRFTRIYGRHHDSGITLKRLYERDNGKCYLCGGQCDYKDCIKQSGIFSAGQQYPSIDHVVPISKGGLHTWDNVKLAHKGCNERKGVRT